MNLKELFDANKVARDLRNQETARELLQRITDAIVLEAKEGKVLPLTINFELPLVQYIHCLEVHTMEMVKKSAVFADLTVTCSYNLGYVTIHVS